MKCYLCKGDIADVENFYCCSTCNVKVNKVIKGKKLTPETIKQLFTNGRTELIEGFMSKNRRLFSAYLVLKDRKMVFQFPNQSEEKSESPHFPDINEIHIRVEATSSGAANIRIGAPLNFKHHVNYGHTPARLAECLALITAANLIKHHIKEFNKKKLVIAVNSYDFWMYLAKERTPRDVKIRKTIEFLWSVLKDFKEWRASCQQVKRPKLEGSPQASKFPHGIFPGIKLDVAINPGNIIITLPGSPDITAQFTASIHKHKEAPGEQNKYILPKQLEGVVKAWLSTVKGEIKNERLPANRS